MYIVVFYQFVLGMTVWVQLSVFAKLLYSILIQIEPFEDWIDARFNDSEDNFFGGLKVVFGISLDKTNKAQ